MYCYFLCFSPGKFILAPFPFHCKQVPSRWKGKSDLGDCHQTLIKTQQFSINITTWAFFRQSQLNFSENTTLLSLWQHHDSALTVRRNLQGNIFFPGVPQFRWFVSFQSPSISGHGDNYVCFIVIGGFCGLNVMVPFGFLPVHFQKSSRDLQMWI